MLSETAFVNEFKYIVNCSIKTEMEKTLNCFEVSDFGRESFLIIKLLRQGCLSSCPTHFLAVA